MRTRRRTVALCLGLICALLTAAVCVVLMELYLRWKEGEPVVHEVHVEAAPVAAQLPKAVPAPLETKPAVPAAPQPAPAETPPPAPSRPPRVLPPEPVISNDVGDISPTNRRIYNDDPTFGYRHVPNTRGTEIKRKGKREIYRATYTTDELGRRVTPKPEGPPPERAVIMVGCSYTFGLCVDDDETMPWQLAMLMPDRAVYNYGVAGYGPQHTLEIFKQNIEKQVPQKKAVAVYSYISGHMNRAVGTPKLVRWYAGPFPWYEISEETGRPVRRGTFNDRDPKTEESGSKLVQAVRDRRSEKLTKEDARLTALLLDEARMVFEKKFQSEGFYFVVYPSHQNKHTNEVMKILKERGARILDYRRLIDKKSHKWFIRDDGHPTPALHRKIAEKLAEGLAGEKSEGEKE
jgi:hypothetical protein